MTTPIITFLMSAYDRPSSLWMSLGSLINQTVENWRCFVLDNAASSTYSEINQMVVGHIGDDRIQYSYTGHEANYHPAWDCYWSAELGATHSTGRWLAFPSDDTYYCPEFIEEMTSDDTMDLVYCDCLYDKRLRGKRMVQSTAPFVCQIDKTSFVVKREKFIGFPDKRTDTLGPSDCDGRAVERMVKMGYRHRKVDLCLCVHN